MKQSEDSLRLYRHDKKKKKIYIDIQLEYYREIYHEWDFAPKHNRDLDEDLLVYLLACAEETPNSYFLEIVCHLPLGIEDKEKEKLSSLSYRNFFYYEVRKLSRQIRRTNLRMLSYGIFGIMMITFGSFIQKASFPFVEILGEGFFIGGWVLFWELFSNIFFKRSEVRSKKNNLDRLKKAKMTYIYGLGDNND